MEKETKYRSITPEEAKELIRSGRAKKSKHGNLFDVPSLVLSMSVLALIITIVIIYAEVYSDTRIVKDYVPQTFPVSNYAQLNSAFNEIPLWQEQENFTRIDSLVALYLYNENLSLDEQIFIWEYSIELRLAQKKYEQALELSRITQSKFTDNDQVLASVLWYRANAYYQLKRFFDAHQQFATVAIMKDKRYSEKAAFYAEEIYQLIRTDGLNALID